MMNFFKLILSFAPWISFLIIAHGSLDRLKMGLLVAAALTVVMAVTKLHRGVIMWVGIAFFTCATVAVVGFESMWTARYMGILANGALAAGTWLTLAMGKPFTLEYARDHADPSIWDSPAFIRTNYILAIAWGAVFTAGTALAWAKTLNTGYSELTLELTNYSLMLACVIFTNWYPVAVKRRAVAARGE